MACILIKRKMIKRKTNHKWILTLVDDPWVKCYRSFSHYVIGRERDACFTFGRESKSIILPVLYSPFWRGFSQGPLVFDRSLADDVKLPNGKQPCWRVQKWWDWWAACKSNCDGIGCSKIRKKEYYSTLTLMWRHLMRIIMTLNHLSSHKRLILISQEDPSSPIPFPFQMIRRNKTLRNSFEIKSSENSLSSKSMQIFSFILYWCGDLPWFLLHLFLPLACVRGVLLRYPASFVSSLKQSIHRLFGLPISLAFSSVICNILFLI